MAGRLYRKKPGGPWYGWYYTPEGKPKYFCTKQIDKEAARHELRKRERSESSPNRVPTDERRTEEALRYLVDQANTKDWSPSTRDMFRKKAGHLLRLLGDTALCDLSSDDVQAYINTRLGERAARETVRKELSVLRAALREAKIPPAGIVLSFSAKYIPRDRYLTREQFKRLLEKLTPGRALWVTVAVYAGARLSELERMNWEDINLTAGWIKVRGTKTAGARRPVPIPEALNSVLRRIPKKLRVGLVIGAWPNVRRDLAAACKRAGVPRVSPNDLRRTYASWLKQSGVDSAVVAKLLGHSSTRMVDLVYGRLADETLSAAVENLPKVPGSKWVVEPGAKRARESRQAQARRTRKNQVAEEKTEENEEDRGVPRAGIEPATRGFSVPVQHDITTRLHKVFPRTGSRR